MKKSQKMIAALAMGSVLVLGAGATVASGYKHMDGKGCEHGHSMKGYGPGMKAMKAVYSLEDLSDEQKDKLDALRKEERNAMFETRDAMQDNRRALRDAMMNGADMETVRKLAREQGNQVEAMIIQRAEARQKLAGILTSEQMDELKSMRKQFRSDDRDDD
jgi:Spy/CpxP family protein refolding chaperone